MNHILITHTRNGYVGAYKEGKCPIISYAPYERFIDFVMSIQEDYPNLEPHYVNDRAIREKIEKQIMLDIGDKMKAQIYVKNYGGLTSLLVGSEENIYYTKVEKASEMMAIERGVSYVKNMLPYREVVEIYPDKVKQEDIFSNAYIKRTRLPIMMGNELTVNKGLQNVCNNNLNVELRFNNIRNKENDR